MKKEHLPMIGVGPIYVISIILLTIVGIYISEIGLIDLGKISLLTIPFAFMGAVLIIFGIIFWLKAVFQSKLSDNIKKNTLVTTGVYSYVRNPIYSAFLMICTGALLFANNLILLILPVIYWIYLTLLMKFTEEKWLKNLYGNEYTEYCKRVNRCIPFLQKMKEELI